MEPGVFSSYSPDLANILGDTDFDFEDFYVFDVVGFQISRFPGSQISRFPEICPFPEIWPEHGLGRAWAKPLGEPVLHDGTALSTNPNRHPFFTVRTRQASLVGEELLATSTWFTC